MKIKSVGRVGHPPETVTKRGSNTQFGPGTSVEDSKNEFVDGIRAGQSNPANSIQTFYMVPINEKGHPTGSPRPVNVQDRQGHTFYTLGVYMNQRDYRTYVNGQRVDSYTFVPPIGGSSY